MEKKYDKDIPLAVHVKELQKLTLDNREADFRDAVARAILDAAKSGLDHKSFKKFPYDSDIEIGFTNAIYTKIYQELAAKGYKCDYSQEQLRVSWDV